MELRQSLVSAHPPLEHGHRVRRVCGKGTMVVLIPLPPAAGRAIDRAIGARTGGPILLNSRGAPLPRPSPKSPACAGIAEESAPSQRMQVTGHAYHAAFS